MTADSNLKKKALGLGSTATLLGGSAGAMLVGLLASSAGAVGSTTFVVDTLDDGPGVGSDCAPVPVPGSCSLRDALDADSDGDTITFASGLTGTITLYGAELEINSEITISGPGADVLTIDANDNSRVFYLCAGPTTEIAGLTITGGSAAHGGGLYDECSDGFTLRDVVLTGNDATGGSAGGLYSGGTVTVINSTISYNTATDAGGGIVAAAVVIEGSTISGNTSSNYGGGVMSNGAATITNSTIAGNASTAAGSGGVKVEGVATVVGSTFSNNTAAFYGGGLVVSTYMGTSSILASTFDGNVATGGSGGGIAIAGFGSDFLIANTTVTGNSAIVGGGITVIATNTVSLFQDTVTSNTATSTDALYSGGGVHLADGIVGFVSSGSIVSDNTAAAGPADIGLGSANSVALAITANSSLLGVGSAIDSRITVNGSGNVLSDDPGLEALADNGGPTKTMALMADSVAVDAGPNPVASFTGNSFDQRGTGFPRIVGGVADIGAFEWAYVPGPTTTTTAGDDPVVPAFTG